MVKSQLKFWGARRSNGASEAIILAQLIYRWLMFASMYVLFILFSPDLLPFSDTPRLILFVAAAATLTDTLFFGYISMILVAGHLIAKRVRDRLNKDDVSQIAPISICYHLKFAKSDGWIYLVQRSGDGVYKIGETSQLEKRLKVLNREYGPVSLVGLWEVPSRKQCEKIALQMTEGFRHEENGRAELRQMTDGQILEFINDFSACVSRLDLTPDGGEPYQFIEGIG